jgi:hypothetical protein
MTHFEVKILPEPDIAGALLDGLWPLSSLRAHVTSWAHLVEAMGVQIPPHKRHRSQKKMTLTQEEAANWITIDAMPRVSEANPRRAEMKSLVDGVVEFTTPNRVNVILSRAGRPEDGLVVTVRFNRDSCLLASRMLAGFVQFTRDARPLLFQAAAELAGSEK